MYAKSNKDCFYYEKRPHIKDYYLGPKHKPENDKTTKKVKRAWWQKRQEKEKAVATRSQSYLYAYDDNDNLEPYFTNRAFMIKE